MRRIGLALLLATLVGCGGSSNSNKTATERHVCGYIVDDAKSAISSGLRDLQAGATGGGGSQVAAQDFADGAKQLREDIATLPANDELHKDGEQVAVTYSNMATALRTNGDLNGASKALTAPGDALQTRCRAVEP